MSSVGIRKVWNVAGIWCGVLDIRLDVELFRSDVEKI